MKFEHISVLKKEVLQYLDPQSNENFIDCTLGGGGHAKDILDKTSPGGKLLGIDLDPAAIKAAKNHLKDYKKRIIFINDNYKNFKKIIYVAGFNQINGILLDLGLSSYEMQDSKRGFSFQGSTFLDMRFGDEGETASDILNNYKEEDLIKIFKEYGEERYAKQIAREIVARRKVKEIIKTDQLVEIIEFVYSNKPKPKKIHVATKVFQALRIEVNQELESLKQVLPEAFELLEPGGRLVIISFHSLEDRIVKHFFKNKARGCLCPPEIPVCRCNHEPEVKILTKKAVIASESEINANPRSRSAKLRAIVKL